MRFAVPIRNMFQIGTLKGGGEVVKLGVVLRKARVQAGISQEKLRKCLAALAAAYQRSKMIRRYLMYLHMYGGWKPQTLKKQ